MKKKYGFTLIELLAVITVLSIVALIALPLVVNNIEEEKKQSARISTNEYIKSFHSTIVEVMADDVDNDDDEIGLILENSKEWKNKRSKISLANLLYLKLYLKGGLISLFKTIIIK